MSGEWGDRAPQGGPGRSGDPDRRPRPGQDAGSVGPEPPARPAGSGDAPASEHLDADDLEALVQREWSADQETALRERPAWQAHLIVCSRCATELGALRRALGLAATRGVSTATPGASGTPRPARPASAGLLAGLARLRERLRLPAPDPLAAGAETVGPAPGGPIPRRVADALEPYLAAGATPDAFVWPAPEHGVQVVAVAGRAGGTRLTVAPASDRAPAGSWTVLVELPDGARWGPTATDETGSVEFADLAFDPAALGRAKLRLAPRPGRAR